MLVLSRKIGEKIIINDEIEIVIIDSNQSSVKLGVNAPKSVSVYREELYKEIKNTNKISNTTSFDALNELQNLIHPDTQKSSVIEKFTAKVNDDKK